MQYFKDFGPKLFENGYEPIPVVPNAKRPSIKNWNDIEITGDMVSGWANNGKAEDSTGTRCRYLPTLDIDVQHRAFVEQIVAEADSVLGRTVRRVGALPKAALFYRCSEPFTKMSSRVYVSPDGKRHKVEILGDGQQCVVFGVHPDTKKPYRFVGKNLAEVHRDELPIMTPEKAQQIIGYFEANIPKDWKVAGMEGTMGGGRIEDDFDRIVDNAKAPLDISVERVRRILYDISPDVSYDVWCNRIGKALYHQFDGGLDGLELWDEWSSGGSSYESGLCEKKWSTFSTHAKGVAKTVTFATVMKLAKEHRKLRNTLDGFLIHFIYVATGDLIYDLTKPPHHSLLKALEFKHAVAGIKHDVPAPTQADPDRTKTVPLFQTWFNHEERKTAQGTRFDPTKGRVFEDDHGLTWVNSFHLPECRNVYDPDKLRIFFDHMLYLIPCDVEREWFIGWLAFNLQRPGDRCLVTPLHVAVHHGTGRGWIVQCLNRLLGVWNCKKAKMPQLAGEGSGVFNDYLDDSLLVCIEEVREGSKRYQISDKVRDTLSDPYMDVNVKYGRKSTKRVYANFFMMSNHPDALTLTEEDRRINVLTGPDYLQPLEYYQKLYDWLDTDGVDHLRAYLMHKDISTFNWQRSMKTPGRSLMIESNRSETEQAFFAFLEEPPQWVMTLKQICHALVEDGDIDRFDIDENQILKLLQHHADKPDKVKIKNKNYYPWILKKGMKFTKPEMRDSIASYGHFEK